MFNKNELDTAARKHLRPVLKKAGFTRFVRRNAWRITAEAIDLVSVQLVRDEVDERFDIRPSRTFFVNMACCSRSALPASVSKRTGQLIPAKLPMDYDCRYRYGLDQPRVEPLWEVSADGSNLQRLIKDMIEHVVIEGLPWFEACHARISDDPAREPRPPAAK